ncbi:hypothetical protein Tco_0161055, partial [Tanacetum coccineum]
IKSIMEYRQWNEVDDYAEWVASKLISANHVLVRDMIFDPDTMNFDDFMRNRFIPKIAIQRRSGYLRLRLRTSEQTNLDFYEEGRLVRSSGLRRIKALRDWFQY